MKYYSTNKKNLRVSFKEAVLKGLSEDGGLFMPESIPYFGVDHLKNLSSLSLCEIGFIIAKNFIEDEIPDRILQDIINDSINFDAPLVRLNKNLSVLELYHGPTLAFKDFGARFMARVFSHFNKDNDKELIILVATSGDTGSAVASGFYEVEGIKVVILYPSGKVSLIQEKQFTTLNKNIIALEVDGTFDDCQNMVKKAFVDADLNSRIKLSSANSINIARLIPQSFYYINALKQLGDRDRRVVFSVPSGNFGNLTAGLFVKKMGVNVMKYIAALNSNRVFYDYLESGHFTPRPSVKTLSNAMDVGNPSNFARIAELYENNPEKIRNDIYSRSFNDKETISAIKEVYQKFGYIIDPHGAVGYLAAANFMKESGNDCNVVILETAHPAKFPETVDSALQINIDLPDRLKTLLERSKTSLMVSAKYSELKEFLLNL